MQWMKLPDFMTAVERIGHHKIWRDRLSLAMILAGAAANLVVLAILVARLRPTEIQVPSFYSSSNGFSQLGPWYNLVYIPVFSLGVYVTNTALSMLNFSRSRIISFYFLVASVIVAILAATVTWVFLLVA